ncbi:MAG TPA: peptide deformylase [Polyangia bacterium]|nr:peptide deformylase [Polyangia bacterium]
MARRTILQLGDARLWTPSRPVDARAAATAALVRDLADTLAAFRGERGFGRAIAAPQIGALERVIVVNVPGGFAAALCNPRVVDESRERFELWDDCFSFPDLMVRVERARRVRVEYEDERGAAQTIDAEEDLAELLQHELDHLDGILAVDRAVSPRAFAMRSVIKGS